MITTKYSGPTDTRGSKIVARGFGRQLTIAYNNALNSDENHKLAAEKLMDKVNSTPGSQIIYGHYLFGKWDDKKNGYVWG